MEDINEQQDMESALIAMQIILHAGNARNIARDTLKLIENEEFDAAEEAFKEADREMIEAHRIQTDTIQNEARGNKMEFSILFVHAQDTLMTSASEIWMMKAMLRLAKKFASKENENGL